ARHGHDSKMGGTENPTFVGELSNEFIPVRCGLGIQPVRLRWRSCLKGRITRSDTCAIGTVCALEHFEIYWLRSPSGHPTPLRLAEMAAGSMTGQDPPGDRGTPHDIVRHKWRVTRPVPPCARTAP